MARTCGHESLGHDDGPCCEVCRLSDALAASQAECVALREALISAHDNLRKQAAAAAACPDCEARLRSAAMLLSTILSRAPGDRAALRGMLTACALKVSDHARQHVGEYAEARTAAIQSIVSRVMGEAAPEGGVR